MTTNFNGKQITLHDEHEEFFGGEMKPFVSFLHAEFKKVEKELPNVPAIVQKKVSIWRRFIGLFSF